MTPEFKVHMQAAHLVLVENYAKQRGIPVNEVSGDVRTHLWRDKVVGLDSLGLWKIVGNEWRPTITPAPVTAKTATLSDAVAHLKEHRPNLSASEVLREARTLEGSVLPSYEAPKQSRTQQRDELREAMTTRSIAERREYAKQFGSEE